MKKVFIVLSLTLLFEQLALGYCGPSVIYGDRSKWGMSETANESMIEILNSAPGRRSENLIDIQAVAFKIARHKFGYTVQALYEATDAAPELSQLSLELRKRYIRLKYSNYVRPTSAEVSLRIDGYQFDAYNKTIEEIAKGSRELENVCGSETICKGDGNGCHGTFYNIN